MSVAPEPARRRARARLVAVVVALVVVVGCTSADRAEVPPAAGGDPVSVGPRGPAATEAAARTCLADADEVIELDPGAVGDLSLADVPGGESVTVDARAVRWRAASDVAANAYPVVVRRAGVCLLGGDVSVGWPDDARLPWLSNADTDDRSDDFGWKRSQGVTFKDGAASPAVVGTSVHDVGDALVFGDLGPKDRRVDGETVENRWEVRGVRVTRAHDDCVQNDSLYSGVIDDSLFDGCFTFYSSRPSAGSLAGGDVDGAGRVVEITDSLVHLELMPTSPYSQPAAGGPAHGDLFKVFGARDGRRPPEIRASGNLFLVDDVPVVDDSSAPVVDAEGRHAALSCDGVDEPNTVIWGPGTGVAAPEVIASLDRLACFRVVGADEPAGDGDGGPDGSTWRDVWERQRAEWLVSHAQGGQVVALEQPVDALGGATAIAADGDRALELPLRGAGALPRASDLSGLVVSVVAGGATEPTDITLWGAGPRPDTPLMAVEPGADAAAVALVVPGRVPVRAGDIEALDPASLPEDRRGRPVTLGEERQPTLDEVEDLELLAAQPSLDAPQLLLHTSAGEVEVTVAVVGYVTWTGAGPTSLPAAGAAVDAGGPVVVASSERVVDSRAAGPLRGRWPGGEPRTLDVLEPDQVDRVDAVVLAVGTSPRTGAAVRAAGDDPSSGQGTALIGGSAGPTLVVTPVDRDGRVVLAVEREAAVTVDVVGYVGSGALSG